MKKHNIQLSYKDLHAIKHAFQTQIYNRGQRIEYCNYPDAKDYFQEIKDKEYDEELLERITERIEEIKDKYKIGD